MIYWSDEPAMSQPTTANENQLGINSPGYEEHSLPEAAPLYRPADGWNYKDVLVILLLAFLVILFHWRLLAINPAERMSYAPGDFQAHFWAFSTFEARELSQNRLPLWNPYTYGGSPFWADAQSGPLYPPSLATSAVSGLTGGFSLFVLEIEAIVHFWLGGCFIYLFVKRLARRRWAALISALVFTFSGYLTGYPSQQLAVLLTDIWLPLILYFLDKGLIDRNIVPAALKPHSDRLNLSLAALSWGIALLAGHPQSAFIIGLITLTYALFLILKYRNPAIAGSGMRLKTAASRLFSVILVLAAGCGLAAVQLLPAAEYTRLSVRAAGNFMDMSGGFPLYDVLQVLFPGVLSHYSPLYIGLIPSLLAVWATVAGKNPEKYYWLGLIVFGVLISFGRKTILYPLLFETIPGFSLFRGQERWAFAIVFALAILVGLGLAQLQLPTPSGAAPGHWLRSLAGLIAVPSLFERMTTFALLGFIAMDGVFFYLLNGAGWDSRSPFYTLLGNSCLITLFLFAFYLAMLLQPQKSEQLAAPAKQLPIAFIAMLIIFDLFTFNWQTNLTPQRPEWHTAMPAIIAKIKEDAALAPGQLFRVQNEYKVWANYGMAFEVEDLWGESPLRLQVYDKIYKSIRMERIWELLNVKYVITWRKELYAPSDIIFQEQDAGGNELTYLHRLKTPAPRAWMVHKLEQAADKKLLKRLDADSFHPLEKALLSDAIIANWPMASTSEREEITFSLRLPGQLRLTADVRAPGMLILSEVSYPGWKAFIDGQPADILTVDALLRGLPLSAGRHTVELKFEPLSLYAGTLISLSSLLSILIAALLSTHRHSAGNVPTT
jgi:hypothetical protein